MSPLEYLRRQKRSMTAEQQARFLEITEAVDANIRAARVGDPTDGRELVACGCWPRYVGECRCGLAQYR